MDVTYDAMNLAIQFSTLLILTLTLVVAIVVAVNKRK